MTRPGPRTLVLLAAAGLLVVGLPIVAGDYLIGFGFSLLLWIALTESWIVLSGMTGYVSLGHAVFVGTGAYVMVLTWSTLPFGVAIALAGATSALLALVVGYPCLRVRGPYFVMLTFGVAELVKFIVVNIEATLGRFGRLLLGAPGIDRLYYAMAALAGVSILLAWLVRRSRFGAGLRAIRENEEAAESLGVNVARYKVLAFALSAVVPGMVGAVMVLRTTYFEPLHVFNPIVSLTVVVTAIVGGSDDARGPLYGALFLVLLSELLWANAPQVYMVLLGFLLIGFVLWAPEGIHGQVRAVRTRLAR